MALSKSLSAYSDVARVFTVASEKGEAAYRLSSPNAAIRWRQRAYYYRKLLAEAGYPSFSEFELVIPPEDKSLVKIRPIELEGIILDGEGNPVKDIPEQAGDPEYQKLLGEAEALAKELGLAEGDE